MNSLQFSFFKGGFYAILFFVRFFSVKRTKNYSGNGEFYKILRFILVIGVFLSGILPLAFRRYPVCVWKSKYILFMNF